MPFVTEAIWQNLPHEGTSIVTASWPVVKEELSDDSSKQDMEQLMEIIRAVRTARNEVNTPMSKEIPMIVKTNHDQVTTQLEENRFYLERFCNPSELVIAENPEVTDKAMTIPVTGAEVILPLEGLIDMDKERARLTKELEKWQKELDRVNNKLANERFVSKAPEKVINEEKEKQVTYTERYNAVKERLAQLK